MNTTADEASEQKCPETHEEIVIDFDFLESNMQQIVDTLYLRDNINVPGGGGGFIPKNDIVYMKLSPDTQVLSAELQAHYVQLIEGIFGVSDPKRKKCLKTLKTDHNMNELLPFLALFIKETVEKNIILEEPTFLIYAVKMAKNLFINEFVRLQTQLHIILPAVLSCVLARKVCRSYIDDHLPLRDLSAVVIAEMCYKYQNDVTNITNMVIEFYLKPLVNPNNYHLTTIYGAVKGMSSLGSRAIKEFVLPNIKNISPIIMTAEQCFPRLSEDKMYKKLLKESKYIKDIIIKAVGKRLYQENIEDDARVYMELFGYMGRYLYTEVQRIKKEESKNITEDCKGENNETAASSSSKTREITFQETKAGTAAQTSKTAVTICNANPLGLRISDTSLSRKPKPAKDYQIASCSKSHQTADSHISYVIPSDDTVKSAFAGTFTQRTPAESSYYVSTSQNQNTSALEKQAVSAHNVPSTSGYQSPQFSNPSNDNEQIRSLKTFRSAAFSRKKCSIILVRQKDTDHSTVPVSPSDNPTDPAISDYSLQSLCNLDDTTVSNIDSIDPNLCLVDFFPNTNRSDPLMSGPSSSTQNWETDPNTSPYDLQHFTDSYSPSSYGMFSQTHASESSDDPAQPSQFFKTESPLSYLKMDPEVKKDEN